MSSKNVVRATMAGLGMAGGAILTTVVIPVATATANAETIKGIEDESGTYVSAITTTNQTEVLIFDNSGSVTTTVTGLGPLPENNVHIYDNTGLTNTDLATSAPVGYNVGGCHRQPRDDRRRHDHERGCRRT